MKKPVKILSLLLLACMLLPATTACKKDEKKNEDTTTAAPDVPDDPVIPDDPEPKLKPRDKSAQLKVLFIGNSFTYYNSMNLSNGTFYQIANKAGYTGVSVSTIYKGGYYLHQFLDPNDSYGKQVLAALNSDTKYDIVIIQEQSANPISSPADFYTCCRQFKELIDKNGGEMWLYSTWGYKTGHSGLKTYGKTPAEMEMKLRAAYTAIGEELNVPVIYAGAAMTKAFETITTTDVYDPDKKHPSPAGSYLIACTIFGTVFGVDPLEITFNGKVPASDAAALREIASEIVNSEITVDPKYATKSEGVALEKSDVTPTPIATVIYRDDKTVGDGWMTLKSDANKTFSGIRGDKDKIASEEYSSTKLTDQQKADIADIGYGVSVIGIDHMDATKKGTNETLPAGKFTSVGNLVNGHWGSSYMAAIFFDSAKYKVTGEADPNGEYTGLITLNFGKEMNFESIGYFSGSLLGFAQAEDVYVSSDGKTWTKVESACYDAKNTPLASVDTATHLDPWNSNKPTVLSVFPMNGATGKYIRVGIIRGGQIDNNKTGLEEINTRELVVFGTAK